eukprot:scaffold614_cov367-Prasinococcus_capsulatus_cf.AAC.22
MHYQETVRGFAETGWPTGPPRAGVAVPRPQNRLAIQTYQISFHVFPLASTPRSPRRPPARRRARWNLCGPKAAADLRSERRTRARERSAQFTP